MPFLNILNMYSTLCPERLCTFCNLAVNGLQLRFTWPPLYLDAALPAAEGRGVVTLLPRNNSGPRSMTSRMLPHTVRQGLGNWIQLAYSLSCQWKALAANRMWSMPGETERKDRLGLELCAHENTNENTHKHSWRSSREVSLNSHPRWPDGRQTHYIFAAEAERDVNVTTIIITLTNSRRIVFKWQKEKKKLQKSLNLLLQMHQVVTQISKTN